MNVFPVVFIDYRPCSSAHLHVSGFGKPRPNLPDFNSKLLVKQLSEGQFVNRNPADFDESVTHATAPSGGTDNKHCGF